MVAAGRGLVAGRFVGAFEAPSIHYLRLWQ